MKESKDVRVICLEFKLSYTAVQVHFFNRFDRSTGQSRIDLHESDRP